MPETSYDQRYDVIVVGLGGHGSATLYHLAKRGVKVLGIEQYSVSHNKGSSHGESRIIRLAYHESPEYVPLLRRAWELWKQLERETGQLLLCETGCLETAAPDFNGGENCFQHSLLSARQHNLEHEVLSGEEVNRRFPGYGLPSHFKAVLAPGGILASERCIEAHIEQARRHGARVATAEAVVSWTAPADGGDVTLVTDRGQYLAGRVVFAAGAWMPHLIPELQTVLTAERQVIGWFEVLRPGCCRKDRFPVGVIEDDVGYFYNFPVFEEPGMKIGKFNHLHERVDRPEKLKRDITHLDEQVLREGVQAFVPAANGRMLKAAACMFTNTPDHHFILDRHPLHEQVYIASPCSGHGYKFCSVIGEIMADLALEGRTQHNIELHKIAATRLGHKELLDRIANSRVAMQAKL